MPTTRQERIQELLVHEISEILRREVKDPRIGFVTVTGAEVSPDLGHARIYVSIMGSDAERAAGLRGLNSASRFVRREFGRRAKLRIVPEIRFSLDTGIERGARIQELLLQAKREQEETEGERRERGPRDGPDEDSGGGSGDLHRP
ncbi:MAG: 30S ribosome-binding factor RbfA [Armatimonadetes bacterium]|nr:30S ribosome-binding factor RbfA [Armatimonadota bacterium]